MLLARAVLLRAHARAGRAAQTRAALVRRIAAACQSTPACRRVCASCAQLRAAFLAAEGLSALRELLDNPSDRVSLTVGGNLSKQRKFVLPHCSNVTNQQ